MNNQMASEIEMLRNKHGVIYDENEYLKGRRHPVEVHRQKSPPKIKRHKDMWQRISVLLEIVEKRHNQQTARLMYTIWR